MEDKSKNTETNIIALFISGTFTNVLNVAISAGILFLAAGRIDWSFAWIYILSYLAFRLASLFISIKKFQKEETQKTSLFDRILDIGYGLTHPLTLIIAGFEFSLTQNPQALGGFVQGTAFLFLILTFALMLWTQWENPNYFSNSSTFQNGQKLVNTGPYQFIRHPGYAGLFMLALIRPLLLGSRMGLLAGIVGASIMILRTVREDWALQKNSEEYKHYAETVRYKIFSGVW
jgi:protein-S-isoprenylcysteine O-methyltransferase Ste14